MRSASKIPAKTVYWLRWWDERGYLLLWGTEQVEQEAQQLPAAGLESIE